MKKTTYISGLTLVYSDTVIDRTGVDAANAQDRAIVTEHSDGIRLEAGFDERGDWHRPEERDNRQHGTGIVRAVALSLPFWIAAIWAIVHYAQKVGSPW